MEFQALSMSRSRSCSKSVTTISKTSDRFHRMDRFGTHLIVSGSFPIAASFFSLPRRAWGMSIRREVVLIRMPSKIANRKARETSDSRIAEESRDRMAKSRRWASSRPHSFHPQPPSIPTAPPLPYDSREILLLSTSSVRRKLTITPRISRGRSCKVIFVCCVLSSNDNRPR